MIIKRRPQIASKKSAAPVKPVVESKPIVKKKEEQVLVEETPKKKTLWDDLDITLDEE